MRDAVISRRNWVVMMLGVGATGRQGVAAQDTARPRAGQGAVGELFNPDVAGRPRTPTVAGDNDAAIRAVEQKLGCTCGCTLDIFTCRTTDFTCTYSPALHREVIALASEGKTEQQIIDAFVDKYGEKILMAPKPRGFNRAGYVVPSILIGLLAIVLAFVLRRKIARGVVGEWDGGMVGRSDSGMVGEGDGGKEATPPLHDPTVPLSDIPAAELERLNKALKEIDA